MFEVITCTINTGRVVRKLFDTRADADRHVTRWEEGLSRLKRNRRNYRVEIQYRELLVEVQRSLAQRLSADEPAARDNDETAAA